MPASAVNRRRPVRRRRAARSGRPPRALAGEAEERILDAAAAVFLERGFEGATLDEIAEVAHAGKPTIYARFPGKEALFTAVMLRMVQKNTYSLETLAPTGTTFEHRLEQLASAMLRNILVPPSIGLLRLAIAEARRFPSLASNVNRMARERGQEAVGRMLGELARAEGGPALPAFSAERLPATARRFTDLVVLPIVIRALFGVDLAVLRAEIGAHVAAAVAFFLAGCRNRGF
jgi:AcrR family transcriptional regulator